jgi:hypothetical protein
MASTNLCFLSQNTTKILNFSLPKLIPPIPKPNFLSVTSFPSSFPRFLWSKVVPFKSSNRLSCRSASTIPVSTKDYEVLASYHSLFPLFGCLENPGTEKENFNLIFCEHFLGNQTEHTVLLIIMLLSNFHFG